MKMDISEFAQIISPTHAWIAGYELNWQVFKHEGREPREDPQRAQKTFIIQSSIMCE